MILTIVSQMNLKIQQLDIKGAYLNDILKGNIYMKQPKSYTDGTDKICHLIKTLYKLKQFRHKWNTKFDEGVQEMGFTCLLSDPCAYIRWQGK